MHELTIADAILDAVRKEAGKYPGAHISKVAVRVGGLSGVVPEALSFGFECLVRGSELEPLTLAIEQVPRRQHCPECGFTFEPPEGSLACPQCGQTETRFAGGDELDVVYMEMEEK